MSEVLSGCWYEQPQPERFTAGTSLSFCSCREISGLTNGTTLKATAYFYRSEGFWADRRKIDFDAEPSAAKIEMHALSPINISKVIDSANLCVISLPGGTEGKTVCVQVEPQSRHHREGCLLIDVSCEHVITRLKIPCEVGKEEK